MRTDEAKARARPTEQAGGSAGAFALSDYFAAVAIAGLLVFVIECVDRLVALSQSLSSVADSLQFGITIGPAGLVGSVGGLLCAALLLGGRGIHTIASRLSRRSTRRYAQTVVVAAGVAVIVALVAWLSSAFPNLVQEPLHSFLKRIDGRVVPIPFLVGHFEVLFVAGIAVSVMLVMAADRVLSSTRSKIARVALGLVSLLFLLGSIGVYAVESRVFFGRYERSIHMPADGVVCVLAFLSAAGFVASSRRPIRTRQLAAGALIVILGTSAVAFARLGSDENRRSLLWRRSVIARRAFQAVTALADRDGDGFASLWRNGDPDDGDAGKNPFAVDVPSNGVDENGFGGDAPPPEPPAAPAVAGRPRARNFLFVAIDTLRADRMSLYGYGRPTTPRIAEWASKARVFERAYSQGSNTGLSFASMQRSATGRHVFDRSRATLFGTLADAGYTTAQINARRDDVWLETRRWRRYRRVILDGIHTIDHTSGDQLWHGDTVTTRAIEYLSALPKGTPHATWVHYLDPHEPREKMAPFDFGDTASDKYDTEVAFADREVGRLLDFLASSGATEDTIVVLMADHGESFGEHGMDLHGNRPYDDQIHVPLVVWSPGIEPARISTPVAILDIAPTVLDALGLPGLEAAEGVSLLTEPPLRPIFSETPTNLQDVNFFAYAVTDDRWRFIYDVRGGTRELYDLVVDPQELVNLADMQKERAAALESVLGRWLDRVGTVRPGRGAGDDGGE